MPLGFILTLVVFRAPARAVELGLDRLQDMGFARLTGKCAGLITNHTGVDLRGVKTRLILHKVRGVNLVALFSPEIAAGWRAFVNRLEAERGPFLLY